MWAGRWNSYDVDGNDWVEVVVEGVPLRLSIWHSVLCAVFWILGEDEINDGEKNIYQAVRSITRAVPVWLPTENLFPHSVKPLGYIFHDRLGKPGITSAS